MGLTGLLLALLVCPVIAGDVVVLTGSNFEEVVTNNPTVLVEFYAPWCGHCKKLEPEYEKAAKKLKEANQDVVLAKCDGTEAENERLKNKYDVRGFPTLKVFKNGDLEEPVPYNGPRDAVGIVDYVMRIIGPASVELEDKEDANKFMYRHVKVVGVFPDSDIKTFKVFMTAADALREDAEFGHTFDASIIEMCTDDKCNKGGNVFLVDKENDVLEEYAGGFNADALKKWIIKSSAPKLVELTQDPRHAKAVKKIFGSPLPRLLGISKLSNEKIKEFKEALIAVDEDNEDIDVLFVDPAKNDRVVSFFDLKEKQYPYLIIHDHTNNKKYVSTDASPGDVKSFVADFQAGKLKPLLKSADIPASNDAPVTVVVGKNFDEIVFNPSKTVLLELYAPWCGHCKKLAPIYEEVGAHFKDNDSVVIAKIDGTTNDVPSSKFKLSGYPSIYLVTRDGKVMDYDGRRTKEDIIKFVADNAGESTSETDGDEEERDEL